MRAGYGVLHVPPDNKNPGAQVKQPPPFVVQVEHGNLQTAQTVDDV